MKCSLKGSTASTIAFAVCTLTSSRILVNYICGGNSVSVQPCAHPQQMKVLNHQSHYICMKHI